MALISQTSENCAIWKRAELELSNSNPNQESCWVLGKYHKDSVLSNIGIRSHSQPNVHAPQLDASYLGLSNLMAYQLLKQKKMPNDQQEEPTNFLAEYHTVLSPCSFTDGRYLDNHNFGQIVMNYCVESCALWRQQSVTSGNHLSQTIRDTTTNRDIENTTLSAADTRWPHLLKILYCIVNNAQPWIMCKYVIGRPMQTH